MIKSLILIPALAAVAAVFSGTAGATAHDPSPYQFVEMTGAQEVPGPGDPDGVGIFAWRVSGRSLCYVITAHNIQPATAAHIHEGRVGVAGPIVVTLQAPTRGFASDCIRAVKHQTADNAATTLTRDELHAILQNPSQFYTNVHNAEFPDGAIRGQLTEAV
ncbi:MULTISPECIES: CHRD domain-containing protein [unclassified Nonomuraea]|uniref:CHRD domain-containing protein n=1 Tax=Nonomuraea sp. NPDC003804 TaxID=3154547 RepID=UPI0033B16351